MGCEPYKLDNGNGCPYTQVGQDCVLSCNKGFVLKGSKILQCGKNQKWKIGIEPFCDEFEAVTMGMVLNLSLKDCCYAEQVWLPNHMMRLLETANFDHR